MSLYKAEPKKVEGKWRVLVHKDGESLFIGSGDGIFMNFLEYNTKEGALSKIESDDRLVLKESTDEN